MGARVVEAASEAPRSAVLRGWLRLSYASIPQPLPPVEEGERPFYPERGGLAARLSMSVLSGPLLSLLPAIHSVPVADRALSPHRLRATARQSCRPGFGKRLQGVLGLVRPTQKVPGVHLPVPTGNAFVGLTRPRTAQLHCTLQAAPNDVR